MKRTERHHLKQDELVSGIGQATHWFQQHRTNVVNALLVALGAALLLGGIYVYRERKSEEGRALLAEALKQYHGEVGSETEDTGAPSSGPRFATAEEKYRTAVESLEKVANEFGSYDSGRQARYYAGICHAELEDFEGAERSLQMLRSGNRDLLYYLASKALASVATERGNHTAAAEIYRPLVEDAQNPLPKDYLLFELAKAEERAGNLEQARQYYDRMVAEHPESQLRGDALSRREHLELESTVSGG
ncbi:MAG TPA: tetratricopeptide repeat protein [Vicinamibacteria bacterium]|nr:tetratricopeptide repeat protein [Vicinamibacteria bacterium]